MAILEREQFDRSYPHRPLRPAHAGHHRRPVPAEVRGRWPDIVRIILSGYTDAEDIITGVNEAGIWQYLLKPWQPEQLLLTLQRAAEVWRLQQENQRLSLDLRTAEPVLKKRQVDSKQEKVKSSFGLAAVIRAPGSPLNAVCDMVEPRRPVRPVGDGDRRIRHRQGNDRPRHPLRKPPRQQGLHHRKLRRAARHPARIRTLRLQARRLHRRGRRPRRPLPAGRWRHAVPRRNRRNQPGLPGQAAARAAGRRVPPARQQRVR
jgi:hypothetical protein